jgi:hypothetical protein
MKAVKIFMGLGDTCGYYAELEKGLNSLGVPCTFTNAYPDRIYKRDFPPCLVGKVVEWIAIKRVNESRGSLTRRCWTLLQALCMPLLFLTTLFRYNVYIFAGGTSFFPPYDLWLLKFFRKRVIMVFHGTDSRAPYLSSVSVGAQGYFDVEQCARETRAIKKYLQMVEKYADVLIDNPAASHLHGRKVINWHDIGIPFKCSVLSEQQPANTFVEKKGCVILHAPTRPEKGSAQIEEAINSLKNKGHEINFIKLVARTNAEVLEAIAGCDFVVDELFSDVFMASFATEAASFGKPAIVGLYEYEKVLACISEKHMIPPVMLCTAEGVEAAIEKLILDKEYRLQLGSDARNFVERQWCATEVAQRYLLLAQNKIPQEWWFDPKTIDRLYGWGLTDKRAREVICMLIERKGLSALQLSTNPDLEQKFLSFAFEGKKSC